MFISLVHDLVPRTYGAGRAFASALLALGTKILEPKVYRIVNQKRKIGGHNSRLKPRSQEGMEYAVPNPAHLAKPCPEKDRRNHHLVVSVRDGPGQDNRGGGCILLLCRQ